MQIDSEEIDSGITKITLNGRMDMQGVDEIKEAFEALVGASSGAMIVDMSGVPYMSSIGIRCLLVNAKTVNKRGKKYFISAPQDDVKSVLEMSGIDQIIPVYESLDRALENIS